MRLVLRLPIEAVLTRPARRSFGAHAGAIARALESMILERSEVVLVIGASKRPAPRDVGSDPSDDHAQAPDLAARVSDKASSSPAPTVGLDARQERLLRLVSGTVRLLSRDLAVACTLDEPSTDADISGLAELKPREALRLVTGYLYALAQSVFPVDPPPVLGGLAAEAVEPRGKDELLVNQLCAARAIVLAFRRSLVPPPADALTDLDGPLPGDEAPLAQDAIGFSPERPVEMAPESEGARGVPRLVVIQIGRRYANIPKLSQVLSRYDGGGISLRASSRDRYQSFFEKVVNDSRGKGYLEFAVYVTEGISSTDVVQLLAKTGAIKREAQGIEQGRLDTRPGSNVRVSEWMRHGRSLINIATGVADHSVIELSVARPLL